jgi:hypothetical protein
MCSLTAQEASLTARVNGDQHAHATASGKPFGYVKHKTKAQRRGVALLLWLRCRLAFRLYQ